MFVSILVQKMDNLMDNFVLLSEVFSFIFTPTNSDN